MKQCKNKFKSLKVTKGLLINRPFFNRLKISSPFFNGTIETTILGWMGLMVASSCVQLQCATFDLHFINFNESKWSKR